MNTNYFLNLVAGNVLGSKTNPPIPSNYYVGLSTTPPSSDGTGWTEPASGAGYARALISSFSEPDSGTVSNAAIISFGDATASWGVVTHFLIFDSSGDNGNLLMYGPLSFSKTIDTGDTVQIRAGALNLSVADP